MVDSTYQRNRPDAWCHYKNLLLNKMKREHDVLPFLSFPPDLVIS